MALSTSKSPKRPRLEGWLPYSKVNDPQHWRACAEEVRAMVANVHDPGAKETLLKVAAGYEDMANKAEQRVLWVRQTESSLTRT